MRVLLARLATDIDRGVRRALAAEGYAVDIARDRDDILWSVDTASFDAVLLFADDAPTKLVARIRDAEAWPPILVVMPREQADGGAVAQTLDAGADDVLRAPYDTSELQARVRSLMRRRPEPRPTVLRVGDLTLDPALHLVQRGSCRIDLHPKKFAVLAELMRRPGVILSRTYLIDRVFAGDYDGTSNVIDSYVSQIRTKIDKPFGRQTIKTIRAVGYVLDPQA